MSTVIGSETPDVRLINNPLFKLYESHLVLNIEEEKKVFHIDEISNVRYSKKRNFTINITLLFLILFTYCFLSDFHNNFFLSTVLLVVAAVMSVLICFCIRNHNYTLFINIKHFGFREFKISKKESPHAEYFVSIFKPKFLNQKLQNDLNFVHFKQSS